MNISEDAVDWDATNEWLASISQPGISPDAAKNELLRAKRRMLTLGGGICKQAVNFTEVYGDVL